MDRNLTVLIAEDNEDDFFLLERAFRNLGLTNPTQLVTDGEQVIQYLLGKGRFADRAQFPFPSVLFLDIKMPRVDGFGVLQWLQDHPAYNLMPKMIFTTSSRPSEVTQAYQRGANAYLVKPLNTSELEMMLKRALDFWAMCAKPQLPESAA